MVTYNNSVIFIIMICCFLSTNIVESIYYIQPAPPATYGLWNLSSSWSGGAEPIITDVVSIFWDGDFCVGPTDTNIIVNTLYLGNKTLNVYSKLMVLNGLTTQRLEVYENTNLILVNPSFTSTFTVLLNQTIFEGSVNNYGYFNFTGPSLPTISYEFINHPGAIVNFETYLYISLNSYYDGYGSTFINGLSSNGSFYLTDSPYNFANKVNNGYIDLFFNMSGTLELNHSTLATDSKFVYFMNESLMYLYKDSVFNFTYEPSNSTDPNDIGYLIFIDNAYGIFEESQVNLENAAINCYNTAVMHFNISTLNSNSRLTLYDSSKFQAFESTIYLRSLTATNDNSRILTVNSNLYVVDTYFVMLNSSLYTAQNSTLNIKLETNPDINIVGLLDDSQMNITDGSYFNIDAVFIMANNSLITIDTSSSLLVSKQLIITNATGLNVNGQSSIYINNEVAILEHAYLHVYGGSTITIADSLLIDAFGKFEFIESSVFIKNVLSFSTQSPSKIINSTVDIDGSFFANGVLLIADSRIHVRNNFTSINVVRCNDTTTVIESGDYFIVGDFQAQRSNFSLESGAFHIEGASNFSCYFCMIDINGGDFVQSLYSNVDIVNTTLAIHGSGRVQSHGNIKLSSSGIKNNGEFILQSDIITDQNNTSNNSNYIIENQGQFTINGVNTSNINVKFTNSGGVLNINQNSNIQTLEQLNGTISLQNGSLLSSNEIISLQGGIIQGNGEIHTPILEQFNSTLGGNEQVNKLLINGSLLQSLDSSTQVYITDQRDTTHFNLTGSEVVINGTLIVRIEDTIVFSSESLNETKQILTSQTTTQGTYATVKIVYYNKETKEEYPPCKPIKTEQTEKGYSVLLDSTNPPNQGCDSSKKKSITVPLAVGLVVGIIGAAALVALFFVLKKKTAFKVLLHKTGRKLGKFTRKDQTHG